MIHIDLEPIFVVLNPPSCDMGTFCNLGDAKFGAKVLRFIGEMGKSMGCLPFSSLIASISHRVIAPILAYILVLLFENTTLS